MTTSEHDKELRSLISDVMADLMVDVSLNKLLKNDGDIFEKGRQYIKSHNSRLNLIMELITADRKRVALESRIDPFDFVESCEPDCDDVRHAYHQGQWDMATRIKAQQEEVK